MSKLVTNVLVSLRISKYSGSTLTLSELGRGPIQVKATVLSLMYRLRLEHGTDSTMLNNAFVSMKEKKSKWLNKVEDLLWKIGLKRSMAKASPVGQKKSQVTHYTKAL